MPEKFKTEQYVDFSKPENRDAMLKAIAKVNKQMGKHYPLVIGGKKVTTRTRKKSINPANTSEVVGEVSYAGKKEADMAMAAALKAFETWKYVPAAERASYLFKAAAEMRRRRLEFDAWMVVEVGKNWLEADADTAEAIDFLEFYGRQMLELNGPRELTDYKGHDNQFSYIPLGVGLIIPPWNFPNAIMLGTVVAAIVTGNTTILKPASDAPIIAAKALELFWDQNLPAGVINYLPGKGDEVGDYLVNHPKTRFISFTGSREVGLKIIENAAKMSPGQIWIKRVVAEMGGKDAILVDSNSDLDAAAEGIVIGAFGFQGQKCSACSRAIIDAKVYDKVASKVVELASKLTVGDTRDNNNYMGPVSSAQAYDKIQKYISVGKKEGKLLLGGTTGPKNGYFINPTIFGNIKPNARIANEEIFGPVLALIKSKNFDDGLKIVNSTEYGLTGAVFSNDRSKLERARREFHVGNLYFNRKCTGALVDVEPFGGFNMSGTDSKAGSRDYLQLFMQGKTVCEKL